MMTLAEFMASWNDGCGTMIVRTSGSTGVPKNITVEKSRMEASARATCSFLRLHRGDTALLCLPMDYIAGKMMAVRAMVCGLRLVEREPDGHPLRGIDEPPTFAAFTPMQVYNTLADCDERRMLEQIRCVIVGGGAISGPLARELSAFDNAIWSTYGMTETLSHIALRRLSGNEASEWYEPMPGVEVRTDSEQRLVIDAPHVCAQTLTTNDIAIVDKATRRFKVLGRRDNVICSGGIKIQAEEAERMLSGHLHGEFMVTRRADDRLGEAVVLVIESGDAAEAREVCRCVLPKYWQPKHIVVVEALPRTENGKLRRIPF